MTTLRTHLPATVMVDVVTTIGRTHEGQVFLMTSSGRVTLVWAPGDARAVAAALVETADEIERSAGEEAGS